MLKRLSALLKKDMIIGYKNYYVLIVLVTAVLFATLVNFIIPKDTSVEPTVYAYLENKGHELFGDTLDSINSMHLMDSRDEVINRMKKSFNSLGMVIKTEEGVPTVEFILQGHENEKLRNLLELSVLIPINKKQLGDDFKVRTHVLRDVTKEKVDFNLLVLPLFISMEPAMLGFFLIATMVFFEKEEGTIMAYRTTPGRIAEYLASKVVFMALLGILSTTVIIAFTMGITGRLFYLLFIVLVVSMALSSAALLLTSLFDNLSKAMIWLAVIMIGFSVPMVSYFYPDFSPFWIKLIPTYPLMFAVKEVLFPAGNPGFVVSTIISFGIAGVILFALSVYAYRVSMARE